MFPNLPLESTPHFISPIDLFPLPTGTHCRTLIRIYDSMRQICSTLYGFTPSLSQDPSSCPLKRRVGENKMTVWVLETDPNTNTEWQLEMRILFFSFFLEDWLQKKKKKNVYFMQSCFPCTPTCRGRSNKQVYSFVTTTTKNHSPR